MENNYKKRFEEKNPFPGWRMLMQLSATGSEELWSACSNDTGTPDGMIRILKIPAFNGEYDCLKEDGMKNSEIAEKFRDDVASITHDAESLIKLDTAHVVKIKKTHTDIISEENKEAVVYILTDYYPTFSSYYLGKKINRATLLAVACDICDAIDEYNSVGFYHSNVQLENVFVAPNGKCMLGNLRFNVQLDSLLTNPSDNRILRFIAPEIANGEDYDNRSDIYSLGLTLYFKFNGNKLPFVEGERGTVTRQEANIAILRRIDGETLIPPVNADQELSKIILKACEHNPEARYQTPSDFKSALVRYAETHGITLMRTDTDTVRDTEQSTGNANVEQIEQIKSETSKTIENMPLPTAAAESEGNTANETTPSQAMTFDTQPEDILLDDDSFVPNIVVTPLVDMSGMPETFDDIETSETENTVSEDDGYTKEDTDDDEYVNDNFDNDEDEGIKESENAEEYTTTPTISHSQEDSPDSEMHVSQDEPETEYPEKRQAISTFHILLLTLGLIVIVIICLFIFGKCTGQTMGNHGGTTAGTTDTTRNDDTTTKKATPQIPFPYIVGKKESEALKMLKDAGYIGEPLMNGIYSDTIEEGVIVSQSPDADTSIYVDDSIKYTVSLGKAPSWTPDVSKLLSEDAEGRLTALGYNVTLTYAYSDTVSNGRIIKQSIAPGTEAPKNSDISLVVSKGAPPDDYVAVSGLEITSSVLVLVPGENRKIEGNVLPLNATTNTVLWSSDDTSVVTVKQDGTITAISIGSANITVTSVDGDYKAICKVTVQNSVVNVTSIGFRITSQTLQIGESKTRTPWLYPSNATNKYVTFRSSDTSVATVDDYGKVTAISAGTAEITATASDGGYVASYTVTVVLPAGYSQVPSVKGMKKEDAIAKITAAGLTVKEIYAISTDAEKGVIISQNIEAGALVDEGSSVTITIGNGTSEWSDWLETLPSGVTGSDITENKTVWSYRDKETKTFNDHIPEGWTADNSQTQYGEWSDFGEWSETQVFESDSVKVESKTQWRSRNRIITGWSDWTDWTIEEAVASESKKVEKKIMYRYRTYEETTSTEKDLAGWVEISHSDSETYCEWTTNTPPSSIDPSSIETRTGASGATEYRWKIKTTIYYYIKYSEWSDWSETRPVGTKIEVDAKNYYRSCTAVYGFGDWSEWGDTKINASDNLDVDTRVMYRSSTRNVTYTCTKWTEWSSWQDTEVTSNSNREVRSQVMYRYKIVR